MPIDPKGTKPGLTPQTDEPKQVHIKCKNDGCDSILAIIVEIPGMPAGTHLYRCVQCHRQWGIRTGGNIDLS